VIDWLRLSMLVMVCMFTPWLADWWMAHRDARQAGSSLSHPFPLAMLTFRDQVWIHDHAFQDGRSSLS
jgi:hypothetical protein